MRQDNSLKATSSYVRASWLVVGILAVIISGMAGILFGPSNVDSMSILKELIDNLRSKWFQDYKDLKISFFY